MAHAIKNEYSYNKARVNEAHSLGSVDVLLTLEAQARAIDADQELLYFIANESRRILPYRQSVVFSKQKSNILVSAVSSVSVVDRSSAFILDMQDIVRQLEKEKGLSSIAEFSVKAYSKSSIKDNVHYPFDHALWVPFVHRTKGVIGGVFFLKEKPWIQNETIVVKRLGEFYSYTLSALLAVKHRSVKDWFINRKLALCLSLVSLAAMFIPVPMSSLAPIEVIALNPEVVTAPITGVIDEISVKQNSEVKKGDVIIELNNTVHIHKVNTADQAVNIALAKLKQVKQSVLHSPEENQSLAILKEELYAAKLDLAYAKEQLELVSIRAETDGVVIYEDSNEWIGKPVSVGEHILRIADPTKMQFRLNVPVKDSISLEEGAAIKAYLDADPVNPLEGTITSANYHASALSNQELAYRVNAEIESPKESNLRIGMRGTAKVYGEQVSLFFYLFRRPISWFRQFFGL